MQLTTPDQLADIAAIQHLKARYFRYVDTKNWQALANIFTSDATLFFPENQSEPQSVTTAIPFIAKALTEATSVHHGHMPEIEILSADSAQGIWAMEDRVTWPQDKTGILGLKSLHGFGHYHEKYKKVNGLWLIESLILIRLSSTAIPLAPSINSLT